MTNNIITTEENCIGDDGVTLRGPDPTARSNAARRHSKGIATNDEKEYWSSSRVARRNRREDCPTRTRPHHSCYASCNGKEILKEIFKAENNKRTIEELHAQDERIKAGKARVAEMPVSLQTMRHEIDTLRAEVLFTRTAVQVRCSKEPLLGMKLACPTEKVGGLIGRREQTLNNS
ncbi:hypothetical protein MPSEU_000519200 [Mayamaea pseudoterrestris]|nr:hypothetical protein MPSEU_000519200 [Mayamaea pseudoterrestris]